MKTNVDKLREALKIIRPDIASEIDFLWEQFSEAILKDEMEMLNQMEFINLKGNTARELIRDSIKQLLKGEGK